MHRLLITSYHVFVGVVAIFMLLSLVVAVSFILTEGVLSYFFAIDLIQWIERITGLDLRALITASIATSAY